MSLRAGPSLVIASDSEAISAENSQQTPLSEKDIIPLTPPLAKGDLGGFSEKKTLNPGEFVFDIKDGKLWLEAKETDLQKQLKAIAEKAKNR